MFYSTLLVLQFVTSVQSSTGLNIKEFAESQEQNMKTFDMPKAVKMKTGYLNDRPDDADSEHKIFYRFYKSQAGKQAPVIIWYMGGPGVETTVFSMKNIGPQLLHQGFHENKYGWHKFSNLVFTDWPYGTGFSNSKNPKYKTKPQDYAPNATRFIKRWTERHPDFKGDIYIAGDSSSGMMVPLIAQYAIKEFKKTDKELAGRFKGIILEGPTMSTKYVDRDGQVLGNTLFHNLHKKNVKKYEKKIQETALLSETLFGLEHFTFVDKILNRLQRYKPISANYYDLRHTTFENRKNKLMPGADHHVTAGLLLAHIFIKVDYDVSHKSERFFGTGHGGPRLIFDVPELLSGLQYVMKANIHEAYEFLYENGIKIGTYFGEYDTCFTVQGLYDDFKKILPKDDYHELVHNGWIATNDDSMVKKMKNIHIGFMNNAGHALSNSRHKATFNFVRNFVNDKD